jgi:hypothetical protein
MYSVIYIRDVVLLRRKKESLRGFGSKSTGNVGISERRTVGVFMAESNWMIMRLKVILATGASYTHSVSVRKE